MSCLLKVENLTKIFYGSGLIRRYPVTALNDVSFEVEEGEIFGLVGESGSGKTTLARTILFLEKPTSGSIFYENTCLNDLSAHRWRKMRSKMQIIFQDPNSSLNPRMTIRESLEEGLLNQGIPRRRRNAEIKKLLDQSGISQAHMDWYPHEFSGGMKQRIVIARALSMKPQFLILDEPVSNLDVSIQAGIINLLMDMKHELNLTYIFISHDLDLIGYLSTRIGVLRKGRLLETGETEEVLNNPKHPYTKELVDNPLSFLNPKEKQKTALDGRI